MALPKSIGIKLYDDCFVPVLTEGEVKNKKVVLTTVRDNQQKAIIELYEGYSDKCANNEYLGKLTIDLNRDTDKGEPGLEVHLRLDDEGILYAKAWDQDSKVQNEIRIEHSSARTIIPETLSDDEINKLDEEQPQEIPEYYNNTQVYEKEKKGDQYMSMDKENSSGNIVILLIVAIILIILGIAGFFIVKAMTGNAKSNKEEPVQKIETPVVEEPVIEEPVVQEPPKVEAPVVEEKKEVIGINKLEGKKHFIRRGDNLWNICKRYYRDPWFYPDLAEQNGINNPRLILAGTYIVIPPKSNVKRWDFSR